VDQGQLNAGQSDERFLTNQPIFYAVFPSLAAKTFGTFWLTP
jgi:hypothetical protein